MPSSSTKEVLRSIVTNVAGAGGLWIRLKQTVAERWCGHSSRDVLFRSSSMSVFVSPLMELVRCRACTICVSSQEFICNSRSCC